MKEAALDEQAAKLLLPDDRSGQTTGRYRFIELIGEGGMGEVYRAEDVGLNRTVAIKLIRTALKTTEILHRFSNERHILAQLNHDHIARLFDAGMTEDGVPFLVMEYIDGEPIDRYCDRLKLSIDDRLKLFRTVCSAVQYAHQHLIVHRDLKPNNVLVNENGEAKLLDFGIAKLLDSPNEAEATATLLRVMTPEYASPEQVKGEGITTATDVYQLGVLLYELLTRGRPYKLSKRTTDEIIKAICEQEPTKPSQAKSLAHAGGSDKSLRGDLDNIVLKALRKEPARRYQSVADFSEDIRRHLDGLPVSARKDTFGYRAAKFIKRNRVAVSAATAMVLVLIGGALTTAWEAHKARLEKALAEERFNQVRQIAHQVMFDYHDAIATLPGSTPVREQMVKDSLHYLDRLSRQAGDDVSLQRELASAYEKIGQIQGNSYYSNLGDSHGALQSYRKSLELRAHLLAADPHNREFQSELSASHQGIGDVLYSEGSLSAALQSYQDALRIRQSLVTAEPASVPYRRALAESYTRIGDVQGMEGYSNLGDVAGALDNYSKAESLIEALAAADPQNHELQFTLAGVMTSAGMLRDTTGKVTDALTTERRAASILNQLIAAEPNNSEYRLQLLATYAFMRYALVDNDQVTEAVENSRETINRLQALASADPKNTLMRRDLEVTYNALGQDLLKSGLISAALESHRQALAICESISKADPSSEEYKADVAFTLERLGEAEAAERDYRSALENYHKALRIREATLKVDSSNERSKSDISSIDADIGNALVATGDPYGAWEYFAQSIPLAEELSTRSPANAKLKAQLALRYFALGMARLRLAQSLHERDAAREQWQAARDALRHSFNVWQEMKSKGTLTVADAGKPDELAKAIARCDAALSR